MSTPPIPPGYRRQTANLPPEIDIGGQRARLTSQGTYRIEPTGRPRQSFGSLSRGTRQRYTRYYQREYGMTRRQVRERYNRGTLGDLPIARGRARFDPTTGQYYETPSRPEQALNNPDRFATYINRQEQRNPQWVSELLEKKDKQGSRLSSRIARREVAEPGRYRWLIEAEYRLGHTETVNVLVDGLGPTPVALTKIERSIVAQHLNEVHKFVTGQENELWRFRGITVGQEGYMLMTDEFEIEDFGNRGELDFESMYPVTYPVSFAA